MKRPTLDDYVREQFLKLNPESGDEIWGQAEELLKKRRLAEFVAIEGRIFGRFGGDRPARAELVAALLDGPTKSKLIFDLSQHALSAALILAGKLPWETESVKVLISPAGLIPRESERLKPGEYGIFTTALLIEFLSKVEKEPLLPFLIHGLNPDELIFTLRENRRSMFKGTSNTASQALMTTSEPLEFANPELFELSYSLRADELPALLLKRVEGIPIQGNTENVDRALSDLYVHIAKRAQAFGLSLRGPNRSSPLVDK